MKRYKISLSENLHLITIKHISTPLETTISFLEENNMCLVTCSIKPSGFTDIIFSAQDKYISKIASTFKNDLPPHNSITVRSGISCLSITKNSESSMNICKIIVSYFERESVCIERIIASKTEIQVFFPAAEVCGSVKIFIQKFENHLQTLKQECN